MPKIDPGQSSNDKNPQLYGVQPNDNTLTFRNRLMQRFRAQDFVTVKNVDDEPFVWQYLPEHEEDFEFTPDPMKITRRGQPELWEIEPGAIDTIVGANAYVMIEGLYKKIVAKKRTAETPDQPAHVARNFNFSDAAAQEKWIDLIFQGKAMPHFDQPQTVKPMAAAGEPKEIASVGAIKK